MSEFRFYQVGNDSLARVLCELLNKALEKGMRSLVVCGDEMRAEAIDSALWTEDPNSFLPHDMLAKSGDIHAPIIVAHQAQSLPENAQFDLLILLDGVVEYSCVDNAAMVCVMIDSSNAAAIQSSRDLWKKVVANDAVQASFWVQNMAGKWEQKAAG